METKSAAATWLRGLTFDVEMGQRHITIDASGENGDDRGPTPMDLLLAALAGCTAMDVVSILRKSRQPFTDVVVRVEGEQGSGGHPYRYTRLTLVYQVHGAGVDLRAVERAVQLSEERYCSVQATMTTAPEITHRIELIDTNDTETSE